MTIDQTALKAKIDQFSRPSIVIRATPLEELEALPLLGSKFGGVAFFPEGRAYPTSHKGTPLRLLAQINCAEIASLDGFPGEGFLQYYIDDQDDLYGMSLSEEPQNAEVVYISKAEAEGPMMNISTLMDINSDYSTMPIACEHSLTFEKTRQPMPINCRLFEEVFKDEIAAMDHLDYENNFFALYDSLTRNDEAHRIGGYPQFVQYEPELDHEEGGDTLLLQLGWDSKICFGDLGVAGFFVKKPSLVNLDFSKTFFYWDCG